MRYRVLAAVCLTVLILAPVAHAKSSYRTSFRNTYNATYGVTGSRIDNCTLCHPGGDTGSLNSYANAYANAGHNFKTIESYDSDGDGYTNLQEIAAKTYPGDASDKPTPTTGSLTVTILPAEAVTAGAQWRVGTNSYQNSGATVTGLAAGSVNVNFKTVAGWTTPAEQSVTITAGGTATASGTYAQLALVPDVVGQPQAAASTLIGGAGLLVGTITEEYSNTVPSGTVIAQNPSAGSYAAPGTAVALTVSKGVQMVTVPYVLGETQEAAGTLITGAGLVLGTITEEYSSTVPAGLVVGQTPSSGDSVAAGTAVDLTVSKGVAPLSVPNVVGQPQASASLLIVDAGLVVGTITQEYSMTVPAGIVITQTPSAGELVAPDTAVLLTVSKGVQPVITGSVVINKGAASTNTASVSLFLTWSSNAVRMRFSDNGSTWTAWEPLKAIRAYTLPAGDGYKTVRVQFMDIANNRSVTYSDYILMDVTPPTGSITINNGAASTSSTYVVLSLSWSDGAGSGVRYMRFSNDGAHWTAWTTPAPTMTYMLPLPSGTQTVRVQYRDAAGNVSAAVNDYIRVLPA